MRPAPNHARLGARHGVQWFATGSVRGGERGGSQARLAKRAERVWWSYAWRRWCGVRTVSENFGLVIAEALSCGVPVITTRATPWGELEEYRCGWWIELGVEPLGWALREATGLPREVLREMGERGRELVQKRYE